MQFLVRVFGPVAQLLERRSSKPKVVGGIPTRVILSLHGETDITRCYGRRVASAILAGGISEVATQRSTFAGGVRPALARYQKLSHRLRGSRPVAEESGEEMTDGGWPPVVGTRRSHSEAEITQPCEG